jgi:hypothetical protein
MMSILEKKYNRKNMPIAKKSAYRMKFSLMLQGDFRQLFFCFNFQLRIGRIFAHSIYTSDRGADKSIGGIVHVDLNATQRICNRSHVDLLKISCRDGHPACLQQASIKSGKCGLSLEHRHDRSDCVIKLW